MEKICDREIRIMGIVNLTDDSFFAGSRSLGSDGSFDAGAFEAKVAAMLEEGADILDFGACSTRPGSASVSCEEEWRRLEPALRIVTEAYSQIRISIDTFRPEIVRRASDAAGAFIVNDVSGGSEEMLETVGRLGLQYVAMHTRGTPQTMQSLTEYSDLIAEVKAFFEDFAVRAERHGIREWILDPGFGFAKTVAQNWELLRELRAFSCFGRPVLAGLSRKSFLYKPLGISPEEALQATQTADFAALRNGADILRVHDVAPAVQTVRLWRLYEGLEKK